MIVLLHHQITINRSIMTFVTVIQTESNKFEVIFFDGTSQKGILITCWEYNKQNHDYCIDIASKLAL